MKHTLPYRVRLGVYVLDLRAGELRADNQSVLLREQPLRILRMLVERDGDLLTREEIQKKLWPNDTVVEFDHSINAAIMNLRRALGDSAENLKYIETVARRGYRLMVPVQWLDLDDLLEKVSAEVGGAAVRLQSESGLTGKKVSHYRVLDIIGGGGMGVVYRAEDLKLGRQVALKFLPEELAWDPLTRRRFEREARAASSLDHPNICTIYEVEEHEEQPFLVMQLLDGETLRDRLAAESESKSTLPLEESLHIGIGVAQGLQAAHDKGVIHRDIKPANIFLTTAGQVKILDFGIAKLVGSTKDYGSDHLRLTTGGGIITSRSCSAETPVSRLGATIGTAGYMSPEQVRGEKVDARTDIFSFGLVLYEMASGQRAFSGETAEIQREAIVHQPHVPIHELNSKLPPELEGIINRALQKNRELRYQRASEISSELLQLKQDMQTGRAVAEAYLSLYRPDQLQAFKRAEERKPES
jgi:eukaryotic-like serine/threonine-protein kinase